MHLNLTEIHTLGKLRDLYGYSHRHAYNYLSIPVCMWIPFSSPLLSFIPPLSNSNLHTVLGSDSAQWGCIKSWRRQPRSYYTTHYYTVQNRVVWTPKFWSMFHANAKRWRDIQPFWIFLKWTIHHLQLTSNWSVKTSISCNEMYHVTSYISYKVGTALDHDD